jgi:hypothetical protein
MTYTGEDGQKGSAYHWLGDKTGEGEMTNTGIDNGTMGFDLHFIKPWEGHSNGFFKLDDARAGATKVTWVLHMHSSFPWNAFNFMTDRMVGKDFQNGLDRMKAYVESHPGQAGLSVPIEAVNYEAHTYAQLRKVMGWDAMNAFMKDNYRAIQAAAGARISGSPAAIYYTWDQQNHTTDVGILIPVKGKQPVKGTEIIELPQSAAYRVTYTGGYYGLMPVHEALNAKVAAEGKTAKLQMEEYIKGPLNEPDSNKWVTNVWYLLN